MKKLLIITIVLFLSFSCNKQDNIKIINMDNVLKSDSLDLSKKVKIRIAIAAMISPKETFEYYEAMLKYIEKELGIEVELIQRSSYTEVNKLLHDRMIDFAFVCSGPYVAGKKVFDMEIIVAPVVYGRTEYYSYIIVHKDAPYKKLDDIGQTNFAFTDPKSNTGCLVPTYELSKRNKFPKTFFKSTIFTNSHDISIEMVARKVVDVAAVDHLIWEYLDHTNPKYTSQTKIIEKFGPFGIPPIVSHPDCNQQLKKQVQEIFLNMHKSKAGKVILEKIMIDKFVIVDDSLYNSVREMQKWLQTKKE